MDKDQKLIWEAQVGQIGGLTFHRGNDFVVDLLIVRNNIGFVYSGHQQGSEVLRTTEPDNFLEEIKRQGINEIYRVDYGDIKVIVLEASKQYDNLTDKSE